MRGEWDKDAKCVSLGCNKGFGSGRMRELTGRGRDFIVPSSVAALLSRPLYMLPNYAIS